MALQHAATDLALEEAEEVDDMLDKRKSSFGEEGVTMPGDLWGYEDGSDFGAGWPDAGEHGGGARRNSLRRRSSNASAGTIDNDEDRLISPDRRPSWFSSHRGSESGTGSSWFGSGSRLRNAGRRGFPGACNCAVGGGGVQMYPTVCFQIIRNLETMHD